MSDLQSKTDEELNRMLAEMLGWKFLTFEGRHTITDPSGQKLTCGIDSLSMNQFAHMILESYCADLNAVAKVEAGLTDEQFQQFSDALWRLIVSQGAFPYSKRYRQLVSSTARQRTIALIQTLTP